MTAATMTLGGPLSIACPFCAAAPQWRCNTGDKGRDTYVSRPPHAARVKAAPPAEEVGAGDLVLVQLTPGRGAKHLLALLVEPGDTPLVRLWRGGPAGFATPRRVVRSSLLRRAPEDDPRVAPARACLAELEPVRARIFDDKEHGRIWIVDVTDAIVVWSTVKGETRGIRSREEWRRSTLTGETAPTTTAPVDHVPDGAALEAP